jgi:predicted ATPase
LVAYHYTEGGLPEQAIPYWQKAGERNNARSAYREAITHLTMGLKTLQTLPQTPVHLERELAFQMLLGLAFVALKGYAAPEVLQIYDRAQMLCHQMGDPPQVFPVLYGLARAHFNRAAHQTARTLGKRLLHIAHTQQGVDFLVAARTLLQSCCFCCGEFPMALSHGEQANLYYDQRHHPMLITRFATDNGIVSRMFTALILWHMGYPDQAQHLSAETVALAEHLAHPLTLAFAYNFGATVMHYRREPIAVQTWTEAAVALATEHGFTQWCGWGPVLQGWVHIGYGRTEAGITQMHHGLATWQSAGAAVWVPHALALLADGYGDTGQPEQGLAAIAEALEQVDKTGEYHWAAEIYRLQGELLLQQKAPNANQGETCFQHALDIARRQQAKSLELRAAMSLSRLWQRQGKRAEARQLLREIYGWFTEGFETADLQEAKALLAALS